MLTTLILIEVCDLLLARYCNNLYFLTIVKSHGAVVRMLPGRNNDVDLNAQGNNGAIVLCMANQQGDDDNVSASLQCNNNNVNVNPGTNDGSTALVKAS